MKGYDAFAGVVKSGGKTRRAAKMVILDADHPDVVDFIDSKLNEEKKAWALIEQGYDPQLHRRGLRQRLLPEREPQRPRDRRVHAGRRRRQGLDDPRGRRRRRPMETYKARDIFRRMADAAWVCGDPGIQYDTTINDWHTSANTDRIHASNPCSEYMFLNDTACNLASLNLMKFVDDDGEFDVEALPLRGQADDHRPGDPRRQRVLPDAADRGEQPQVPAARPGLREPRRAADVTRPRLRLGRGPQLRRRPDRDHARRGVPAVERRSPATTAVRSGPTTRTARRSCGSSTSTATRPTRSRRPACPTDVRRGGPGRLRRGARARREARLPERPGHRPRPDRHDRLHDGLRYDRGRAGHRPDQVQEARRRGLPEDRQPDGPVGPPQARLRRRRRSSEILAYINEHETIEGAPHLKPEHLSVFDCAFKPVNGERSIHYMGHVRMMGAIQPFICGAISKTVNMPEAATAEEIEKVYLEGWKLGLKAIAIYRDNSQAQPAALDRQEEDDGAADADSERRSRSSSKELAKAQAEAGKPHRRRLPSERDRGHPQVRHRRPRGLHHGRPLPGRPARARSS